MTAPGAPSAMHLSDVGILSALTHPRQIIGHITPNWYASIMGTGIVATAGASLPLQIYGQRVFVTVVWLVAATALIVLSCAFAAHWYYHRRTARAYASHPVMSLFYGAPPMAVLTVGAGTLALGPALIGIRASVTIDMFLWTVGTFLGLLTSVWIPFRLIRSRQANTASAIPAWLMPIVPPMVSATTGALLIPHLPDGSVRLAMLAACYAMFFFSLALGLITMTLIYRRIFRGGLPALPAMPTVWIMLGIVGQSITAANIMGADGSALLAIQNPDLASGLRTFGIVFGIAMGCVGSVAFVFSARLTVRAARSGLTFSLSWWSFTFPVGTCVTGATALGTAMGSGAVHAVAVILYLALLAAWATVAVLTVRGTITGRLFLPA